MKFIYYALLVPMLLLARATAAQAPPPPTERLLVISPAVGEVIDGGEKAWFGLFLYYAADDFLEASFYQSLSADSAITLRSRMRDGRLLALPFTKPEYLATREIIERRLKEVGGVARSATPGGAGQEPASATASYPFMLGKSYRIETRDGTAFSGRLIAMNLTGLDFESAALGNVTVLRANITRVVALDPATPSAARTPGYYDIGNGNRLFFAPTGRGLRKNEGTLQDIDVYLIGLNYGVTDFLSLGGYMSVIPGVALEDQLLVFTPKLSLKVQEDAHLGLGVLYVRVPFSSSGSSSSSVGAGVAYTALTYGSADNNLTAGLGYGFVDNEIGSTPLLLLGGQRRITRRVSLISENYIIADSEAGMAGLYGLKMSWRRTSLGLGAAYYYIFNPDTDFYNPNPQHLYSSYIIPVYVDFTFRFGKGAQPR